MVNKPFPRKVSQDADGYFSENSSRPMREPLYLPEGFFFRP